MIIKKVELIDFGNKGIKVTFDGQRKINDQVSAKRENKMKEAFPLPIPLRLKFNNLKYFFLTMLGIWRDDQWTEYLLDDFSGFRDVDEIVDEMEIDDDDKRSSIHKQISSFIMAADTAFSNTRITGYELDGTSIKILGTYEAIEGKPFKFPCPFVSEDDDYDFHQEASEVMSEISSEIFAHLKQENLEIENVKEILSLYLKDQSEIERVKEQTEEESWEELVHRLESKGAIVMPLAGSELEKSLNENNDVEKMEFASNSTVNENRFEEGQEHKDEEKEEDEKDEDTPEPENNDAPEQEEPEQDEDDDSPNKKGDGFF
jgi:hypothetical protein